MIKVFGPVVIEELKNDPAWLLLVMEAGILCYMVMRMNICTSRFNLWLLISIKRSIRITLAAAFIIIGATDAMAIEEATYTVVEKDKKFEIRDYAPHVLAETLAEGEP